MSFLKEDKNKNITIDIEEVYNSLISKIDSTRSYITPNFETIFRANPYDEEPFFEKRFLESRCHAFYRLIGFPVINKDATSFYSPGYDNIKDNETERNITKQKKDEIVKNQLPGFIQLSNKRELQSNNYKNIFSTPNIDSSVAALSIINIKKFNSPFEKDSNGIESPFKIDNQKYVIKNDSIIGTNAISLENYIGDNGTKVSDKIKNNFLNSKYHIIKPFLVDGRIDLSCSGEKKIGVPFVQSNINLKLNEVKRLDRPLIEKIISDRIKYSSGNDESTLGKSLSNTIQSLKKIYQTQKFLQKSLMQVIKYQKNQFL